MLCGINGGCLWKFRGMVSWSFSGRNISTFEFPSIVTLPISLTSFSCAPTPPTPERSTAAASARAGINFMVSYLRWTAGLLRPLSFVWPSAASGPSHLDGTLFVVGFFRNRTGRIQRQLVDQASGVEE